MYVLNKFVFSKVAKILSQREESIQKALDERDDINLKLGVFKQQGDEIISKAQKEARQIIEEARTNIKPEQDKILDESRIVAEKIIQDGKKQGEEIIQNAKSEANKESVEILRRIVKKALVNLELNSDLQEKVTQQIIDRI